MKILYIECNMGAAGDMLMAALTELIPKPENFIKKINSLNIPNTEIIAEKSVKCGITGTHINVKIHGKEEIEHIHNHHNNDNIHHSHNHSKMKDIENIIANLPLSKEVIKNAVGVYRLIAEAESHVHGKEIEDIHFHEVGTIDAVIDVVGCCMLMEELAPDKIIVSPIKTGFGEVKCAHGTLPVPAPAAAYILNDVPIYSGSEYGELCTPTGAALLKYFADEFKSMPIMKIKKIGCGMGVKDFKTANCLRTFIGETEENETDIVCELSCNIDDMTGEEISFAVNKLFEAEALDVFTTAIGMKKNRPAVLLSCLCHEADKDKIIESIFNYTSTIGIREKICTRYTLKRNEKTTVTEYGNIRIKECYGYGVKKSKPEYEDLAKIADKNNVSISYVKSKLCSK